MFRASIVVVNQPGSGGDRCRGSRRRCPEPEEDDEEATYQRVAARSRRRRARRAARGCPRADARGPEEAAERDHRQRRRQQDVQQLDAQTAARSRSARSGRWRRAERGSTRRQQARPAIRSEVQDAPQHGDRQDQHRDQDEQRLAVAVSSSSRIGADRASRASAVSRSVRGELTGRGYTPRPRRPRGTRLRRRPDPGG